MSRFVPHSGVCEALLAPTVVPALPDAGRSSSGAGAGKRKSSAPHGAELPSPKAAAERAALRGMSRLQGVWNYYGGLMVPTLHLNTWPNDLPKPDRVGPVRFPDSVTPS